MKNSLKKILIPSLIIVVAILIVVLTNKNSFAVELPFLEDGKIYKSFVTDSLSISKEEIASDVLKILDYNQITNQLLYAAKPQEFERYGDLWIVDTIGLTKRIIAQGVISARLSSDGATIVLWNKDNEIHLVASNGNLIRKIGVHGAAPIFSHDGRLIVYKKLAESSFDGDPHSLFEFSPYGIAVYDIRTEEEKILTYNNEDFSPIGFSQDIKKLFFHSTRPDIKFPGNHQVAIWVINLDGTGLKKLTNYDVSPEAAMIPPINENAIWSFDRRTAVSSHGIENGIWMYVFSPAGDEVDVRHLADGESPRWVVLDKTISFRITENKKSKWRIMDIQ